ncbi:MAG: tetratricopeptide repeat protein [Deltaproteobacteria bacterium]|nr:tetratricopeptide repeat protein [Deltaproteobacteria bacterium]
MVSLSQQHLALLMEAGYIYLGMQRYQEAREVFEGVHVLKQDSEIPLVALAGVSFCQGKLKEAQKIYEKALKLNPDSLYGKAYLAETLFFDGHKAEAAQLLKEVDRAESKGPVGDFARSLLEAIDKGFTPEKLSQAKELKAYYDKQKKKN